MVHKKILRNAKG